MKLLDLKYFTKEELICNCGCDELIVNYGFITKIEELREFLGFSFIVNSFYRCEKYNKEVGGVKNSYHLLGRAMDIQASGEKAYKIVQHASDFGFRGIGVYPTFIHLDDREQDRICFWVNK